MARKLDWLALRPVFGRSLAIRDNERDALSSRSVPVRFALVRWLDEPTATPNDRLPARGEPGITRATRRSTLALQRRSAPSFGCEGERVGTETTGRGRYDRHARDA